MKFESIQAFRNHLKGSRNPQKCKELATIHSWVSCPCFSDSFDLSEPFEFSRASDPPDFEINYPKGKIGIEVTSFTTGQLEVILRERPEGTRFTSTLLCEDPDKKFWSDMKNHILPDDSRATPHFVDLKRMDESYLKKAQCIINKKSEDLKKYSSTYSRTVLLIQDSLTHPIEHDMNERGSLLRNHLGDLLNGGFNDLILVTGHVNGCGGRCQTSFKL